MKQILITGASTGIGAAAAKLLAPGNNIYLHYNSSRKAAEKTAEEINRVGGTAFPLQADLSCNEGCESLAEAVAKKTGALDVLVNNAGGLLYRHGLDETSWEILLDTFSLNTFSVMRLTALLIPLLRKSDDANIINITSVAARNGSPTASVYATAKGAVDTYTRSLAKGLAPKIRANSIAPGIIVTPFHEKSTPADQFELFIKATPLGKPGYPEDIARTIQFIIDTPFITGESLDINGGMNMR